MAFFRHKTLYVLFMQNQRKELEANRPPMDLARRQPGKKPEDFFALCSWADLTHLTQLFAYYARYVEGRGTLTIRDFWKALPPLIGGSEPVPPNEEITDAVYTGVVRGLFTEVAPNTVALTYSGDMLAADIPSEAEEFIWNDGWAIEWAVQIGAKTATDRLIAYLWYLEQCRQPHPDGEFRDEFLAQETEIANPRWLLTQASEQGYVVHVRRGVYELTDAGRERVVAGFPSQYRTHRPLSGGSFANDPAGSETPTGPA